jgi:hypothetical protein
MKYGSSEFIYVGEVVLYPITSFQQAFSAENLPSSFGLPSNLLVAHLVASV